MSKILKEERRRLAIIGIIFIMILTLICFRKLWNGTHNGTGVKYNTTYVYVVKHGDTLWDIAKKYKPAGSSTRLYINDIIKATHGFDQYHLDEDDIIMLPQVK